MFQVNVNSLMPLVYFYTPWKHEKISSYLMFLRGIERASGMKWVKNTKLVENEHQNNHSIKHIRNRFLI